MRSKRSAEEALEHARASLFISGIYLSPVVDELLQQYLCIRTRASFLRKVFFNGWTQSIAKGLEVL